MEHSKDFEKVKHYYEIGKWSKQAVWNVTVKQRITPAEYEEITGEPFDEREIDASERDLENALEELGV